MMDSKYLQIKKYLLRRMKTERPGRRLPSENGLASHFHVSRMTARRALSDLEREGYVVRIQGKGSFVKPRHFTQGFFQVYPFRDHANAHGVAPRTRVLETTVLNAPDEVAEKLLSRRVILVRRINYFDHVPVRYEIRYLRYDLCSPILHENLDQESIHEILIHKLHLPLTRVWQHLEAVGLTEETASLLNSRPGHPAFSMRRIAYTFDDPVTWVAYTMRGDYYAFENKFSPQANALPDLP
jgi:GntR family transcriptional regulator